MSPGDQQEALPPGTASSGQKPGGGVARGTALRGAAAPGEGLAPCARLRARTPAAGTASLCRRHRRSHSCARPDDAGRGTADAARLLRVRL